MDKGRRKQEIQVREEEVWRLRVGGLTQWQVARQLGISQAAVSKILLRVGNRLAAEFLEEARGVKLRQTEQLERVAAEAILAWKKSLESAETVAVKSGRLAVKDGEAHALPDETTRTVSGQSGNPGLLAQYRGALADIRELWGLNAPLKQEHSGPGGGPIPITEVTVLLPTTIETAPPESFPDTAPDPDAFPDLDTAEEPAVNGRSGLEVVVELS